MPGTPWSGGKTINGVDATNVHPAECVFQDKLYLFWSVISNLDSHRWCLTLSGNCGLWLLALH
jgi:hypothetical protein